MIEYELRDIWRDFTFMKKQTNNVSKARQDFLLKDFLPKTVIIKKKNAL